MAIACYFSILKVRPTPFVVMDEIEAALDDNNVVRFARYMRGMSEKTQFIVITHRRGTMEAADVLYGVTMQEQGVSRMLTINLNDVEKELKLGDAVEHAAWQWDQAERSAVFPEKEEYQTEAQRSGFGLERRRKEAGRGMPGRAF